MVADVAAFAIWYFILYASLRGDVNKSKLEGNAFFIVIFYAYLPFWARSISEEGAAILVLPSMTLWLFVYEKRLRLKIFQWFSCFSFAIYLAVKFGG